MCCVDSEQGSPAEEENVASEQQELVVPATDVQLCSICQEELVFNQARNAFENVIFTACNTSSRNCTKNKNDDDYCC
jgi:hypothetical protein